MSNLDRPRLLSFTLDDWPVLGGPASIMLTDGVAVLVGRNGSGKSAILEGLVGIASIATENKFSNLLISRQALPKSFVVDILTPEKRCLRYEYSWVILSAEEDTLDIDNLELEANTQARYSWNDDCYYLDGDKENLWKTEYGETALNTVNGEESFSAILGSIGLLSGRGLRNQKLPVEMEWLHKVLKNYKILNKQEIHKFSLRNESLLKQEGRDFTMDLANFVNHLAYRILRLEELSRHELEDICARIGLAKSVVIQEFSIADSGVSEARKQHIFEVLIDGINIGYLSDGTLRVLSVLVELISPSSFQSMMIIEEPEQQIHPSLLSKLLNEIQAYTLERDLIIVTHSPQVVSEMQPNQIHLVERTSGRTTVRKLSPSEVNNVYVYLTEEGDLGEWVYSGILDDE